MSSRTRLRVGVLVVAAALSPAGRDLPVASNTRMRYEPHDGGLARVDIFT